MCDRVPIRILVISAFLAGMATATPVTAGTWTFDVREYQILGCQPLVTQGGFQFQLADSPSCGECRVTVSSGGAPLVPGQLHGQVDPSETAWSGFEVDLVESDPSLSATLVFLGPDAEVGRVRVTATGASTLALARNGKDVRTIVLDCCDCLVEEFRILDAGAVGTKPLTLTTLKSRYR